MNYPAGTIRKVISQKPDNEDVCAARQGLIQRERRTYDSPENGTPRARVTAGTGTDQYRSLPDKSAEKGRDNSCRCR
jgi:hypothetical protein